MMIVKTISFDGNIFWTFEKTLHIFIFVIIVVIIRMTKSAIVIVIIINNDIIIIIIIIRTRERCVQWTLRRTSKRWRGGRGSRPS